MKGPVSSTGDSVTDKFSFRCKSAQTIVENVFKIMNGKSKSHLTMEDNLHIKKSFDWEANVEDEDRVGGVTEVSLTTSEFVDPHTCSTKEESSSMKFFEDFSPISQGLTSEYHKRVNEEYMWNLGPHFSNRES